MNGIVMRIQEEKLNIDQFSEIIAIRVERLRKNRMQYLSEGRSDAYTTSTSIKYTSSGSVKTRLSKSTFFLSTNEDASYWKLEVGSVPSSRTVLSIATNSWVF
ncbi:unnamed protein product [Pieris brassicae]|uniref:Uncharacterized protein n=1 Tax=Pieris brassicae TaxID=7116 RepID=A0A9P0TBA9_PIEBR|nr:unnamed protein product [Pieris brassicae]